MSDTCQKLLIMTAGGHGQVVAETARMIGIYDKIAFLDDGKNALDVVGGLNEWEKFALPNGEYDGIFPAIGNNGKRKEWMDVFRIHGVKMPVLIHPTAWVSPSAVIEEGAIIEAMVVVNANAVVRRGAIVGIGALIDHDAVLEECCHVDAGAIVHARGVVKACRKVEAGEVVGEETVNM